jgi:predicted nucleotidyltransferase
MATARNEDLTALAQRVADALPAELVEEVVLTGSVSRGMADELSDIEMLVVTREPLELNRMWQPTTKRLAVRVAQLRIKPDRLAERIEEALAESDARRALRIMTQLQLDTVLLAPSGPNVDRARTWLAEGVNILRSGESRA